MAGEKKNQKVRIKKTEKQSLKLKRVHVVLRGRRSFEGKWAEPSWPRSEEVSKLKAEMERRDIKRRRVDASDDG